MANKYEKNNIFLFFIAIVLLVTTSILLFVGPELVLQRLSTIPGTKSKAETGEAFGGTLGPIIAWVASILTFGAFWVQFKANEQQKFDLQIERFENKFYRMVEIQRENVSEISIGNSLSGRKAFISMFNELRYIYLFARNFLNREDQKRLLKHMADKNELNDEEIFNISYLIFFFGVGQNSTKLILDLIDEKYQGILINLEEELKEEKSKWRINKKQISIDEITYEGDSQFTLRLPYTPFDGHLSRLSHYIRHLYQLVKFINDQPESIINYEEKYNYASTVRAQLSAHEQLLLYYNALSVLGKPWLEKENNLLIKYCMIKSIPIPLADFYKTPKECLPLKNKQGKTMFEWGEIDHRLETLMG